MTSRILAPALCGAMLLLPVAASAQMTLRPADQPVVSAGQEQWYLDGDPITVDGDFYYPAGPAVFFNPYEMVRSGSYRGVPLYTRTTLEPNSVVFVPVERSLLQPYERRRAGELAGTTGSYAPSFPVERDAEVTGDFLPQAAGAPLLGHERDELEPFDGRRLWRREHEVTVTRGAAAAVPRQPFRTALKPEGLNAFYIEYGGVRWFNSGPATLVDPASLTPAGDYDGFTVYRSAERGADTILVPVGKTAEAMMTPYTRRD